MPMNVSELSPLGKSLADEEQIGGQHYKQIKMQPWTYIAANNLDFFQGNVIKYVTRWKLKGGLQDLHKAKHMLEKYIEVNRQ